MKIIVTIPTWNEGKNIPLLLDSILELNIPNLEVVVGDDNSPDGTWKIVQELSKTNNKIHLLHRIQNKGRGAAGIDLFKYAYENGADFVIEMDADFSHQPKHIPELLEQAKLYDVVIGSRFLIGASDVERTVSRQISTVLCNIYAQLMLGLNLTDPNSGFRCYTREALGKIINDLRARGPDIVQDVIWQCKKNNLRIKEIPIEFVDRKYGETTKTYKDFINGALTTLKLRSGIKL
ncbi:MAG: polyprenol monophosphomannose synthase [Nanoarchaeota archaeon]